MVVAPVPTVARLAVPAPVQPVSYFAVPASLKRHTRPRAKKMARLASCHGSNNGARENREKGNGEKRKQQSRRGMWSPDGARMVLAILESLHEHVFPPSHFME
jgi:hypothetical protein